MNLVMLPMWILSGVFFSATRFPVVIQPLVRALPLTAAIDALRGNMLQGMSLGQLAAPVAILLAWLVAWRLRSRCGFFAGGEAESAGQPARGWGQKKKVI